MFNFTRALWKFRQLRNRRPVVISQEELIIFQKCFLSLFENGYYESMNPIFIDPFQMLQFFQKDLLDLVNFIGQHSKETIRVAHLEQAAGFEDIRPHFGNLPPNLDQSLSVDDWVDLAQWEPLQIAKTEIALGRDQRASQVLKKAYTAEFLATRQTDHEQLFLKAKADGTAIHKEVWGYSTSDASFQSADWEASSGYRTPGSPGSQEGSQSQEGRRSQTQVSPRSRKSQEEEGPRREFYQVRAPQGHPVEVFVALGRGLLVGVAALSVGAMIFRFRKADKDTRFIKYSKMFEQRTAPLFLEDRDPPAPKNKP